MREEVAHKEIEDLKLNLKRLGFSQEEIIELVISIILEINPNFLSFPIKN